MHLVQRKQYRIQFLFLLWEQMLCAYDGGYKNGFNKVIQLNSTENK